MDRSSSHRRVAGIELGGTKVIAVLGTPDGPIIDRARFDTTTPDETLGGVADCFRRWDADSPIEALGIASFGPVAIDPRSPDYGHVLSTPKPHWQGADLFAPFKPLITGPVRLTTDVIASALAEGALGAARGCRDYVYMTVGTGIGMGVIAGGAPVVGQLHPEAGHMRVARVPGDGFAGTCPYHGDCLEGLASGHAIAARTGRDGHDLADDDHCWDYVVDALAQGCANLLMTLASDRIVIGGGIGVGRPFLIARVEARMIALLNGYLPFVGRDPLIVPAELGADAGPRGALLLAGQALAGRP